MQRVFEGSNANRKYVLESGKSPDRVQSPLEFQSKCGDVQRGVESPYITPPPRFITLTSLPLNEITSAGIISASASNTLIVIMGLSVPLLCFHSPSHLQPSNLVEWAIAAHGMYESNQI